MNEPGGLARFAPLTGVVFVVLALASAIVEGSDQPDDFPGTAREIVTYYTEQSDNILIGSYIGILGMFFLVWFVGTLRAHLRRSEVLDGRVSGIAFGGGVAAAALGVGVHAVNLAAAYRAEEDDRINPAQAVTVYDLQSGLFIGFAYMLAVLAAATAVVVLRNGALPRWIGFLSMVFAVGLIVPFGNWLFVIASPIWFVAVAVVMYLRPAERTPAATA